MKRYQVHVSKKVTAEIIVEAESEHLARKGVQHIEEKYLQWRDKEPPSIEHIDQIDYTEKLN